MLFIVCGQDGWHIGFLDELCRTASQKTGSIILNCSKEP